MVDRFVPKQIVPRKPGRPPGRRNRWSNAQRREAARTGELPHQFMLRVMRLGVGKKIGDHVIDWDDIKWAVEHAAPYYAARLASLQVKPDGKPSITLMVDPDKIKNLTPEQLVKFLSALVQVNMTTTNMINGELVKNPDQDNEVEDIDPDLYEATIN